MGKGQRSPVGVGLWICAWLWVLTSGCGGADDFGVYRTLDHKRDDEGCSPLEPPASSPPYFHVQARDVAGTDILTWSGCEGNEPTSCEQQDGILHEEIGDESGLLAGRDRETRGWVARANGTPEACSLRYVAYEALVDGDTLSFATVVYGESAAVTPCTAEEASRRGDAMRCLRYEFIDGGMY